MKTNLNNRSRSSILTKLLHITLTYKLIHLAHCLIIYIKDYSYVADTFYSEQFSYILKQYLNVEFHKDWTGRLYSVINPNIDINGNINFNNMVIEIDDDNTNNNAYVEAFIYKQMNLIKTLFNLGSSGFFDYISVQLRHVGPMNQDNYLVIFDMVSRVNLIHTLKKVFKQLFIYGVVITIGWLIWNNS